MNKQPSLEEFIQFPLEKIKTYAPQTMIYVPSGTRRDAVLHNKKDHGQELYQYSLDRMIEAYQNIFDHGIKYLFNTAVIPSLFEESTPGYQENLWRWLDQGLAGGPTLAEFQRRGWRVRIIFGEKFPQLKAAQERLIQNCPKTSEHNLWFNIVEDFGMMWRRILSSVQGVNFKKLSELSEHIYEMEIPTAGLYVATGKPTLSPDLFPPFVMRDRMECYWSEKPGYSLDARQLREILYDSYFVRKTWRKDKTGRAAAALEQRYMWENAPTIGLGQRVGPFWYPQSIAMPQPQEKSL
ncbi:MAG: hypothetical protein H7A32_01180 [Deltaproteobacteria bacterium]|nr:hypothetical protein [Deltaproteobacteria bacterium]